MAASVQFRPHNRDLGMVVREVDEDLAIFLGMKNGEKERTLLAHIDNFEEFDGSTSAEPKPDSSLMSNGLGEEAFRSLVDDSLLNLETGKNEHDWLLAQQDGDEQDLAAKPADASSGDGCISLISEQLPKSNSLDSSTAANKRPLSSNGRKPSSRAATPTRRPALPAKSKPSRPSTPTSRAPSKPAAVAASKPTAAQPRTSTPSRIAPRSSTPTSRATTPAARSKPASTSRTSTTSAPARKQATPSTTSSKSPLDGASSRGKTSSVATKNPVATRGSGGGGVGSSSRPSNPLEMLSVSQNAPQSAKTSLPKRPASASRGRPAAPLSSPSKGKPRQKSCSPARSRGPISNARKSGSTTLSRSRGGAGGGGSDDVNPVLMGTMMVERVVNSRKLAPPKQDEHISLENPKRSSHENSGFGRSLSKKSLDMAMRHMDIRRSVNAAGSLRPVATTAVLSYFSYGNQSSSSQSSSFGVSESPITSSSDSSKSSNCVNSYFS